MSSPDDIIIAHEYALKRLMRTHWEEYQSAFKDKLRRLENEF